MLRRLTPILALVAFLGCHRNVEPFVPGEEPSQPDLSKIFPAGAEQEGRRTGPVELPAAQGAGPRGADPWADAEPIHGVITVADDLADRVPEGAVLFLMARVGPKDSLVAVQRIAAPSLPMRFAIGPADRMGQRVPFAGEFQLSARLDADGDAGSRNPGDLQGRASGTQSPGAKGGSIVLDELL
ncbi:MAG: hypothetical protein JRS35_11920 [Deltaproteobacteria bacterium]|nr:hypothetical protein [Deltaproteobacteria bacterium]